MQTCHLFPQPRSRMSGTIPPLTNMHSLLSRRQLIPGFSTFPVQSRCLILYLLIRPVNLSVVMTYKISYMQPLFSLQSLLHDPRFTSKPSTRLECYSEVAINLPFMNQDVSPPKSCTHFLSHSHDRPVFNTQQIVDTLAFHLAMFFTHLKTKLSHTNQEFNQQSI